VQLTINDWIGINTYPISSSTAGSGQTPSTALYVGTTYGFTADNGSIVITSRQPNGISGSFNFYSGGTSYWIRGYFFAPLQ
jgi:hypothetical protein